LEERVKVAAEQLVPPHLVSDKTDTTDSMKNGG
jgi:hypothetical protein